MIYTKTFKINMHGGSYRAFLNLSSYIVMEVIILKSLLAIELIQNGNI